MAQPSRGEGDRSRARTLVASPAVRTSLGEVVAERLRQVILANELTPGQHLREEEVSESMQVSRGPVRDAFLILEREGLLQLSRHRGATVVNLSMEDLGEVYSLRSAIESLAVRLAIRRHEPDDLDALDNCLVDLQTAMRRRIDRAAAAKLDVDFHDSIFRAAHHERLYASWAAIRMQVYWLLLSRNVAGPQWRKDTAESHARIRDLVVAGDETAAVDTIGAHIRSAYTRIYARLDESEPAADAARERSLAESFLLD